jgi:hypothetical protein
MESVKKRVQKHAKKAPENKETAKKIEDSEVVLEKKYRMGSNFTCFVGDDTGLIKKVKLMYNYQTDIFGDMAKGDDSFKPVEDEEEAADPVKQDQKRQKQEDFSVSTKFDADG